MLSRSNKVAPQEQYYSDSLLQMPTTSDTVFHNLAMGVATPVVSLNMLDSQFAKKPEGQAILSAFDSIKLENETPGMSWSQWLAGEGSNMLGQALNPATWALAESGGFAARALTKGIAKIAPDAATVFMRTPVKELVSKPISQYIPEMIGKEGSEKPLSFGLMAEDTLKNFGAFAGAGVPQSILDNYKADTGHIEWGGVARSMGEMGAFGMAIGSIPFAWGVLRGKVNRGLGREASDTVDKSAVDLALERGHISKDEHQWYNNYLEHLKDPGNVELSDKLKESGSNIINQNGHTANTASNEAMFEIMKPDDVSNLQGVIADQLAGNVPDQYKKALSDFIVHNRMDYIRQNPKWLDGVRGYVDFVNKKLESREAKSTEANAILDKHFFKGVRENMPFSQKELFKMMNQANFESSHMKQIPVTIPENITKNLKIAEKIKTLNLKMKKDQRRGLQQNKQTLRRLEALKASIPKILTPKEELRQIQSQLLDKGLKSGFERSNAYHRLLDLSNVWHNARTLLDRIHLEDEYNKQTAFRDLANQVLKIADSDMPRISKPENVVDYLKRRIEGNFNKQEPITDINKAVSDSQNVPADADAILSEQEQQIKNSKAEEAKKEFVQSTDKMKEFKSSPNIFKNLISCVMGGMNA